MNITCVSVTDSSTISLRVLQNASGFNPECICIGCVDIVLGTLLAKSADNKGRLEVYYLI